MKLASSVRIMFIFLIFAFKVQAVFLLKNKGVFSLKEKKFKVK